MSPMIDHNSVPEDNKICGLCQGAGFISDSEIEYIWNDEENLLEAKKTPILIPCPNCEGKLSDIGVATC